MENKREGERGKEKEKWRFKTNIVGVVSSVWGMEREGLKRRRGESRGLEKEERESKKKKERKGRKRE